MLCGSAASVGVEGVGGAWGAQRRQSPPPLVSRRLESAADAVAVAAAAAAAATTAASFNPITQRCAKKGAVDAVAPRRIYPGPPLVAETSKEDAMEPEAKEEDERRSSTPSPEVASFSFFSLATLVKNVLHSCDRQIYLYSFRNFDPPMDYVFLKVETRRFTYAMLVFVADQF